jgi:hypothetical protein
MLASVFGPVMLHSQVNALPATCPPFLAIQLNTARSTQQYEYSVALRVQQFNHSVAPRPQRSITLSPESAHRKDNAGDRVAPTAGDHSRIKRSGLLPVDQRPGGGSGSAARDLQPRIVPQRLHTTERDEFDA